MYNAPLEPSLDITYAKLLLSKLRNIRSSSDFISMFEFISRYIFDFDSGVATPDSIGLLLFAFHLAKAVEALLHPKHQLANHRQGSQRMRDGFGYHKIPNL